MALNCNGEDPAQQTLEDILAGFRLESAFYFSVSASGAWATLTPHMQNIGRVVMPNAQMILPFHIMLDGEAWCWRTEEPSDKRVFKTGDILLLPRGCDHIIASGQEPGTIAEPDVEIYRKAEESRRPCTYVDLGGGNPSAHFVCGYFGAPRQSFHPLLHALPDLLLLTPTAQKWEVLKQLITIATERQADRLAGGRLVVSRLAETMFVDAVQQHLLSPPENQGPGWLSALRDRQIGAALAAFHRAPMEGWTAERWAKTAGLSRSSFTERFHDLVGQPPMQYVQAWRLQIAANLLAQTDEPVKKIAADCGYRAETSFRRAFKQQTDVTPGAWRALHRPK